MSSRNLRILTGLFLCGLFLLLVLFIHLAPLAGEQRGAHDVEVGCVAALQRRLTSSHLRMRKQRERASSQNCQVTEKLPPQPSPPPFWRSQHHTLTWQRRGAPPAPLLPHPSPSKKACPASEGKKNKPYRPRADPPNDPTLPFCGPTSFCQVYFINFFISRYTRTERRDYRREPSAT